MLKQNRSHSAPTKWNGVKHRHNIVALGTIQVYEFYRVSSTTDLEYR